MAAEHNRLYRDRIDIMQEHVGRQIRAYSDLATERLECDLTYHLLTLEIPHRIHHYHRRKDLGQSHYGHRSYRQPIYLSSKILTLCLCGSPRRLPHHQLAVILEEAS